MLANTSTAVYTSGVRPFSVLTMCFIVPPCMHVLGEVDKGDVLTDYMGPAPPQGTHRYVFLVYEQHMHRELQPFRTKQRPKFNAADWAKRHNLGDPVAATHFEAAPE